MLCLELFSGTGSIGRAFSKLGWTVISVDKNPKYNAVICVDILEWNFKLFDRNHFDFVWASPCCTQYSKAKTVGTRDLEGADKLVNKTLEIIAYFGCNWAFENPETGLLKTRAIVEGLPYYDTTYCRYGYSYRKKTRIWSSLVLSLHEPCSLKNPCSMLVAGRHPKTAQQSRRGSDKNDTDNICSTWERYSIPEGLCDEVAAAANRTIQTNESNAGLDVPPTAEEI